MRANDTITVVAHQGHGFPSTTRMTGTLALDRFSVRHPVFYRILQNVMLCVYVRQVWVLLFLYPVVCIRLFAQYNVKKAHQEVYLVLWSGLKQLWSVLFKKYVIFLIVLLPSFSTINYLLYNTYLIIPIKS